MIERNSYDGARPQNLEGIHRQDNTVSYNMIQGSSSASIIEQKNPK